ncbi:unnamed protein product [Paramecium octaurelia]|uniref:Uncharacterized protein n=1 Tax=Paramecium octaurelia TaxID=43137 RepID=A0A8S1U7J6_PAROT|nr:unnamed protein product [Paramecium octaurelia]
MVKISIQNVQFPILMKPELFFYLYQDQPTVLIYISDLTKPSKQQKLPILSETKQRIRQQLENIKQIQQYYMVYIIRKNIKQMDSKENKMKQNLQQNFNSSLLKNQC